jgi:hypothetical protein
MVGQNLRMLMPGPQREAHDGYMQRYVDTGQKRVIGQIRELEAVRKDGTVFPIELGVSDLQLPNRRMFIGVIRDVSETRRIQRQLADDAARLQRYHDESEREQELAMSIMERQIRSDWLHDKAVQYAVMPARNFSGDVVAVARAPDGALYAMLADATGHGLAAAVSVLPALGAFYRGAARNVPLEVLVTELNDMLCGLLPPGHFVASALVRLEAARPEGRIWVGGVPDVLLLDDDGVRWCSVSAPASSPSASCRQRKGVWCAKAFQWAAPGQIVLCSDGLTEAENAAGQAFGRAGLEQVLQATPRASRLKGFAPGPDPSPGRAGGDG